LASLAPFISRDDLADIFGDPSIATSDAGQIAVDSACDTCRNEAEQTFNEVTDDEVTLDGPGRDALLLPERPVTEVSEVSVNGVVVTNYVLNGNGVLFRKGTDPIIDYSDWAWLPKLIWPVGRQNIVVTYTHGYADDLFPREVRIVALRVAERIFKQPTSAGITSETLGSYSVSYATSQASQQDILTQGEKNILRKYKQSRSA
jgi:hypothetical protein